MKLRVCLAGVTGWVGKALVQAIEVTDDLELVSVVARSAAGQPLDKAVPGARSDLTVKAKVKDAIVEGLDVLIDYTHPDSIMNHTLQAIDAGVSVVMGTSGLTTEDYKKINLLARKAGVGCVAGNFSLTAAMLMRLAQLAVTQLPDWEIIDYAGALKPDSPSGTAYELAERVGDVRRPQQRLALSDMRGLVESRGAEINGSRVHSLRIPGFSSSCEIIFGLDDERLSIRHDAGSIPRPYVEGTLYAVRRVSGLTGLVRGFDQLLLSQRT